MKRAMFKKMLKICLTLITRKYHGRKILDGFQRIFCGDRAPEWPTGNNGARPGKTVMMMSKGSQGCCMPGVTRRVKSEVTSLRTGRRLIGIWH